MICQTSESRIFRYGALGRTVTFVPFESTVPTLNVRRVLATTEDEMSMIFDIITPEVAAARITECIQDVKLAKCIDVSPSTPPAGPVSQQRDQDPIEP